MIKENAEEWNEEEKKTAETRLCQNVVAAAVAYPPFL